MLLGQYLAPRHGRLAQAVPRTAHRRLWRGTVVGATFQFELSGAPIIACISGLTVFGTGTVRAGTFRLSGAVV